MSIGGNAILVIAAFTALALEATVFLALGYGALRFATKFLRMRKDIEELKVAVAELSHRA
jgi:hypothetical protein